MHRCPEGDAACNPVNQQIVAGKPAVSQDDGARAIQWSDVECHQSDLTRGKVDRKVNGLHNCGVGSPIKQAELQQRHRKGLKSIIINKQHIYKAIRRTGVNEHMEFGIRKIRKRRGDGRNRRVLGDRNPRGERTGRARNIIP